MNKLVVAVVAASLVIVGCAGPGYGAQWTPVVDVPPERSQAYYSTDLPACQQYATQVMNSQQGAAAGAIAGALFGALLGAAAGGNGRFNSQMAGVGALSGGASAAAGAEGGQRGIIRRCLLGRGYNVLN